MSFLIFAYGTLRKGCSRHKIVEEYECITPDAVLDNHAMYNLGAFPAIVKEEDGVVQGEIYQVDQKCVDFLDVIEGHPHFYQRREVEARDSEGRVHPCITYVLGPSHRHLHANQAHRIESGNWLEVM